MPVSAGTLESVRELFEFVPELVVKRMFGGAGVWSAGVMFALVIDDELFLKTDDETRPLFEAEGCGPWTYERNGAARDMGYNRAPEAVWDDPEDARRWAGLALEAAWRKHKPKPASSRRRR